MENNKWLKLYNLINEWNQLQPWTELWSEDYISIEFSQEETYYCSIMGKLGNCIGLSIYQGDEGYADLCSIAKEYDDMAIMRYMMYDQNCLTFYMGDRDEVPPQQKKIIKELGLKYRGKGKWPYFVSFQKRFYPYHLNDDELHVFIKVLERLIDIMQNYSQQKIDVDYEKEEMIYAYKKDDQWQYIAHVRKDDINKMMPVELTNQQYLEKLIQQPQKQNQLIIDLSYLSQGMYDKGHSRPINPLVFLVIDLESQMLLTMNLLKTEEDEILCCIQFLCQYIEIHGRPDAVFIRNPIIYCAIADICEKCDIELYQTKLDMIDNILDDLENTI